MGTATPAWLHGGDYDGDLNMFSFDKDFIDVVKATEGRIRQLPVEDLDQQVKDRMMELELEKAMDEEVEFELRGYSKKELEALFAGDNKLPAYLQFCLWLPTPRLRGWACARAERVAHCALKQRSAAAWNLFFRAALTTHKAMDVPKHYKAESLVKAMDEVGKEAKIERKTPRRTKAACTMACGCRCRPCSATTILSKAVETWLDDRRLGNYGAVWLPRKTVVLGEEAAEKVLEALLNHQKISSSSSGRASGSPFGRSPGLLRTSWSGAFGSRPNIWMLITPRL